METGYSIDLFGGPVANGLADEDDEMVVLQLSGYEIRVRTHADNLESTGKPPKGQRLRDRLD